MAPSGGGTGTGDWKTDGQHYMRCQRVRLPVPAAVHDNTEGECGLISKHADHQLVRCNLLFHILNVLVPTSFVLVGKNNNNTLHRVLQSLDRVIICLTVLLSSVLVLILRSAILLLVLKPRLRSTLHYISHVLTCPVSN